MQQESADGTKHFGFGSRRSALEVKVLYLRVSYCPLDGNPESLLMRFPSRSIDKYLEVNGARIPPSEAVTLTLRRDRMDSESVEVTYVSTDHLHAVGSLGFEVLDKEEILVAGTLQEGEIVNGSKASSWSMECNCSVGTSGCVFTRGRHEYSLTPPTMEVCLVGCCGGSPIILTRTVPLMARRRPQRCGMLDAIPEDEEKLAVVRSEREFEDSRQSDTTELGPGKFFLPETAGYAEAEDGDMSWFNAGVRVGVGIGLGMCLGVGIGVGLMVRTYQATTRSFRRRLF